MHGAAGSRTNESDNNLSFVKSVLEVDRTSETAQLESTRLAIMRTRVDHQEPTEKST